ncbi:MAG: hypothetical protein M1834_000741 [Cirrosporium novae-zelandiae]|nr:MAG: hypothetical protein M1834_000741 [Cirrosporium novae-zelandiae]
MAASIEVPKTCKAGVVVNEGPNFHVEVQEVPVPEPAPDQVLIRLNCTGLCYSDIHFMLGDMGLPPMSHWGVRSTGHEGAGVVVKIGADVKNWKVGDRAGLKPFWTTCGKCELCWGDKETMCKESIFAGLQVPGSYQQYVVSPARYTTPIPDGVDDYVAGPVMCSGTTAYRSLRESRLKPGDWAVFPGGGAGVGMQAVQIARAMGFRPIVVDTGKDKRDLCIERGAEAFVDFNEAKDLVAEVVKIADGIGAHGVFVTAVNSYQHAVGFTGTRMGACIMCIGLEPAGSVTMGAPPSTFVFRELRIAGTVVGSMYDTDQALQYAKRGVIKPICTVYPIDKIGEAVERLRNGKVAGRIVVDFNQ